MKTQVKCESELETLRAIKKCKKYKISYTKNTQGILADCTPEKAWNISLI